MQNWTEYLYDPNIQKWGNLQKSKNWDAEAVRMLQTQFNKYSNLTSAMCSAMWFVFWNK